MYLCFSLLNEMRARPKHILIRSQAYCVSALVHNQILWNSWFSLTGIVCSCVTSGIFFSQFT